jgi:hypothetical protein
MVGYLQIFFDFKIIMVKQYGKGRDQVDPVINPREISKKYGIPTGECGNHLIHFNGLS